VSTDPDPPAFELADINSRGDGNLRLGPLAWEGGREWPSPQFVLGDFLHELDVPFPRRVAATLLQDFGSISQVLSASWWQLRRSVGYRLASTIRASRDRLRAVVAKDHSRGPVVRSRQEVFDLLAPRIGDCTNDRRIALYLDPDLHVLRVEHDCGETARSVLASKVIRTGLHVGAAAILLVHFRSEGSSTPSYADREAIARLSWIARDLDMTLLDAWLVAGEHVHSMIR
jgi:DNA repair protein RadC